MCGFSIPSSSFFVDSSIHPHVCENSVSVMTTTSMNPRGIFLIELKRRVYLKRVYEPNPTFHCFFPLRFDLMDPPRARSVPSRGDANPFWSDKAKSEHFLQSARPMDLPPEGIMTLQSSPGPRSRLRELQMCLPEKVAVIKRQERCRWMSDPSQWAWSFEDAGEAS